MQSNKTSGEAGLLAARVGLRLVPGVAVQAGYWWYFGAIGCFTPFIALYYRGLGLSGLQIGVLTAVLPLGMALLSPVWAVLADTWSAHRLVLRCALTVAACAALGVAFSARFIPILLSMLLVASSVAAAPALLDSYALTISEREGRSYGQLRVWGSLGFIAAVWAVGWWMGNGISNAFLIAYAGSLLLAAVATLGLPTLQSGPTLALWHGVAAILRNRRVVLLLITAYLVTACGNMLSNFLGLYLTEIGGSPRLVGTASALAAISELPVLLFGRWLLQRFSSRRILLLAIGVYAIRFIGYGLPPTPLAALAVQLLHGLSFGAYLMSSVTLMHELAGRERAATAQGLLTATSLGLGAITGALVGGALLDTIGAVGVFRVAGVGMVVALLVYLAGLYRILATDLRT